MAQPRAALVRLTPGRHNIESLMSSVAWHVFCGVELLPLRSGLHETGDERLDGLSDWQGPCVCCMAGMASSFMFWLVCHTPGVRGISGDRSRTESSRSGVSRRRHDGSYGVAQVLTAIRESLRDA